MRQELRQRVLGQLKRERLANTSELFAHFDRLLGESVTRENARDIIELWNNQQTWTDHQTRDHRGLSMPPTPSTSSATTSNNWPSLEDRRPLKIPPKCEENGHPQQTPFYSAAEGLFWNARSKHHNNRGSYITSDVLSDAGVKFEEDGVITLRWRPPGYSESDKLRPTLFNIVSKEEAAHIGMTDCDILYGEDYEHFINQQYRAPRESFVPTPPRVPTPPCRVDSLAPSTISVTRSDLPGARPGLHNMSPPEYSLSFKGGPYEFSMKAPQSDAQFLSFAKDVFQIGSAATTARGSTLNANSPMLITGAVDNGTSVHIANRAMDIPHPMSRTISQTGLADQTGPEHRNKRKAGEEVAPADHRRQRKMDISSLLS